MITLGKWLNTFPGQTLLWLSFFIRAPWFQNETFAEIWRVTRSCFEFKGDGEASGSRIYAKVGPVWAWEDSLLYPNALSNCSSCHVSDISCAIWIWSWLYPSVSMWKPLTINGEWQFTKVAFFWSIFLCKQNLWFSCVYCIHSHMALWILWLVKC